MTRRLWHSTLASGWVVAGAMVLAACGSSSQTPAGPSSTPGTPSTKTVAGNGIAQKTPAQILVAAMAALRAVNGFIAQGTGRQNGKLEHIKLVDGGHSKLQMSITQGGATAEAIVLSNNAYIRANKTFWVKQTGSTASALLADRWIEFPANASKSFTSDLGNLDPQTLAKCLGEHHGTLSLDGTTTVDGQSAVVIRDAGDVPGSSPGTLAVASTGTPYPLRVTMTGPRIPGGKSDSCISGNSGSGPSTLTLSDFGHLPPITAPANAVKIPATALSAG